MSEELNEQPLPEGADVPAPETEVPAPPSPQLLKARAALAARYKERNMHDAANHVMSGAWDKEPMLLALVDVQSVEETLES